MRANMNLIDFCYRLFTKSTAGLILLGVIALPLPGCGEQDGGGPVISSLSTPGDIDESANPADNSVQEVSFDEPVLGEEELIDSTVVWTEDGEVNSYSDLRPDLDETSHEGDSIASLIDAPQEKPTISMASTPTGAIAKVTWESIPNPQLKGYYLYYGKQPSPDLGVCSYDDKIATDGQSVTITELEPNTPYFFAVSAYGRLESPCSNEASAITPPAGGA